MRKKELVSFVVPCYNSSQTLPIVVQEIVCTMKEQLSEYNYEIILVNDCSPDETTYQVIKKLSEDNAHIRGIDLARNFGQPSAVMAGMNYSKGDYVVCGDDDGQTPFNELPALFEKVKEGYDVVEARYIETEKKTLFRRIGTFMNEIMASWLINKPKGIVLTSYWIIRRYVADEVMHYQNSYPYLGGLMMRATKHVCNVEVAHRKRISGKSGYGFRKLLGLWLNGFTAFSVKPLRLTVVCGVIAAFIGTITGVVTVIRKILDPGIQAGYTSLLAVNLLLFGILFVILGVLGEYVGRIYISLNNAPQFVVRHTVNIVQKDDDTCEKNENCS